MGKQASSEIIKNRRALRDYQVVDSFETGIILQGTEVKSIRAGRANFVDSHARIEKGEVFLYGLDIQPYQNASFSQHETRAPRKLLLHKREIEKLHAHVAIKGNTLIAVRLYWKHSRVKVELAIATGKAQHDKRQDIKERTEKLEANREVARFNRRGQSS